MTLATAKVIGVCGPQREGSVWPDARKQSIEGRGLDEVRNRVPPLVRHRRRAGLGFSLGVPARNPTLDGKSDRATVDDGWRDRFELSAKIVTMLGACWSARGDKPNL